MVYTAFPILKTFGCIENMNCSKYHLTIILEQPNRVPIPAIDSSFLVVPKTQLSHLPRTRTPLTHFIDENVSSLLRKFNKNNFSTNKRL